jgi:hypothetical protein
MTRIAAVALAAAAGHVRAATGTASDGDVPVAPIPPSVHGIWTNALVLRTAAAEAIVVPDIGRICSFAPADGSNVLYVAAVLEAPATGRRSGAGSWRDYGGVWGWPSPEDVWPRIRAEGASPDDLFEGRRWTGRAWRTADGAAVCSMLLDYGPPLNLRVTRTLRLGRHAASLEIRQRIEQTGPSTIPAGPSVLVRVMAPQRIVFPADPDAEPAVRAMAFEAPPVFAITRAPESAVYRVAFGGEHRLAATAPRPWVAAELPRHLLLLRAATDGTNALPQAAAYVHRGAAYAELELAAPGQRLRPGETIEQTVFLECFPEPADLDDRSLAIRTRLLAGEREAASVP